MVEQQLPDAELDVMVHLWEKGPSTVRQLREALHAQRPMQHGSVFSLLKRLEAKEFVTREKGPTGKALVFRAMIKPGKTHQHLLGDLLDRVFRGSGLALVASLFESRPPTPSEIDDLEKLLSELRRQQKGGAPSGKQTDVKKGKRP